MEAKTAEELASFHRFLGQRLESCRADLSPEEAVDLWRAEHPLPSDRADTVTALREALADFAQGDRGVPIDEFDRRSVSGTSCRSTHDVQGVNTRQGAGGRGSHLWLARRAPGRVLCRV
jgi:hypothetical protein